MNPLRASAEAGLDQLWAELRGEQIELTRIALHGPDGDQDALLVKKVCLLVTAELFLRQEILDS